MSLNVDKLISNADSAVSSLPASGSFLTKWGARGKEITDLLQIKNGFYAYESALLVRPLQSDVPFGIIEWNADALWKHEYDLSKDFLCFAEDIFGVQFCIADEKICSFNPETGNFEAEWPSLGAWAAEIINHSNSRTGRSLAEVWQKENGTLKQGTRLLPKIPFVVGGEYSVNNLFAVADVKGMRSRAYIAKQIRELPDGAEIIFNIE